MAILPDADAIELYFQAAERYREKVFEIQEALRRGDDTAREAVKLVRGLIDHILVIPTPALEPVGLVRGNLAGLLVENPSGTGG